MRTVTWRFHSLPAWAPNATVVQQMAATAALPKDPKRSVQGYKPRPAQVGPFS